MWKHCVIIENAIEIIYDIVLSNNYALLFQIITFNYRQIKDSCKHTIFESKQQ